MNEFIRKYLTLISTVIVLFIAAGFFIVYNLNQNNELPDLKVAEKVSYKITVIAKSESNPTYKITKKGAEDAAEMITKEFGIKTIIEWKKPYNENPSRQAENIINAVKSGTNAILLSASDSKEIISAVNYAAENGVSVMTFDSDVPGSKRFCFYGLNDMKAGENLIDELAESIDSEGQVAVLAGNRFAVNLKERVKGIILRVKQKYPKINIIGVYNNIENPQDASGVVIDVNKKHPELKGWAMAGGWALYDETLLKTLKGSKMKIVAINAIPIQFRYIEAGISPCLLAQLNYKWGYVGISTIIEKIHFKEELPSFIEMDLYRVTKSNMGDWARILFDWGYEDIPVKYLKL